MAGTLCGMFHRKAWSKGWRKKRIVKHKHYLKTKDQLSPVIKKDTAGLIHFEAEGTSAEAS